MRGKLRRQHGRFIEGADAPFEGDGEGVECGLPPDDPSCLPRPVGSSDRVTRYRHFSAAWSLGKWPRARTARR